ncbi:histone deacetylase superfamily [Anaeromyxobacter sp. K]|uniref:histone deacetylase family protein n=1 Tax=Anaeromyxobacter sp. (strain K) TaxID=447217 RepID=UPI00017BE3D8|nr:histone deacetylase [Anaeromyxobacter sp. K]ACG74685.1 histone deacetylase superfamily [Anaeromyxobacter sp. K]
MRPRALLYRLRSWFYRRDVTLWYDPRYRLPLSGLESGAGMEPRRADFVAWWLADSGAVPRSRRRTPRRISFEDLARVHDAELLESLGHPDTLARVFAVDPSDVPVDEVMTTVRLACGGTLGAARETLRTRAPAINLLGGFHHAFPGAAGGFCPVNDVAVAIAAVRAEGFSGRVAVIDLDAHPPDGIAACLAQDPDHWIGSISGSDWGPLEGVDETVLPPGSGDDAYLEALGALLSRMPRPQLAFVLAGGDVLAGDRFGQLGLSLDGARERDLLVAAELDFVPTVWLSAGGYSRRSWRALAGTGMAVAAGSLAPIPDEYDPLSARFEMVSQKLLPGDLGDTGDITAEDLEEALGMRPRRQRLLLGFYTASGIEHALFRYGVLEQLERMGYRQFRVGFDSAGLGDRVRLHGEAEGQEHLLVELILERRHVLGVEVLFVHWLSLRNPRAQFSDRRPRLPGQEVPGLGLAREAGSMLARMAIRLGLGGVAFRPAHFHTAYAARHAFAFIDPERQGRFEALVRDLATVPLLEATRAVSEGRVLLDGRPYAWEADEMAYWLRESPSEPGEAERERERVRFTLLPEAPPPAVRAPAPPGAA